MNKLAKWCLCLFLCITACGSATDPDDGVAATLDTDVDDGRADTLEWRVKTDGLTMWVDTVLEPVWGSRGTAWILRGRVSKSMNSVRAYAATGEAYDGKMISARKFELVLTPAQVLEIVAGKRVYLDFFARTKDVALYHGMVQFGARFADWSGTSGIYVLRAVNPVMVGDVVKFRGRASTKSGFRLDLVFTDDDANPMLVEDAPREYHFDWTPTQLHLAADPPEDPVWFRGSDTASTPVDKSASLQMRLVQMGIGTKAPMTAWPPARCEREVKACLDELETADTAECGWAYEVAPCLDAVTLPPGSEPERFVADLQSEIELWYADHAAEARANGGRTLAAALRSIRLNRVGELDPEEVELFGYDPAHYDVFYHVDPVYPASERIWYGVYDEAGRRDSLHAVN